MLKVGDKLPNFSCQDDKDNLITQDNLKNKKTILFFYPRANTPGCTAQACNLSENYSKLTDAGYTIFGISADKIKQQSSFSTKFGFPYPLLADTEKVLINGFGVWGSKKFQGKEYLGIMRTTFIINEDCVIIKVIDKVKTKDHTNQILD
ncbi:thioredoxin-dependent thiol peroxidase [Flavobacteriaceae bacterium]|jgi:peroxiredoxin Q/BCP|nr:thioredoxin-dependent thiol peroxidase [Flavobacteriaceae bacterium]|tara:strand:- start:753 stop:1199 length:447 start_codon:yes stop_codon:yes gene_type:complete